MSGMVFDENISVPKFQWTVKTGGNACGTACKYDHEAREWTT